VSHSYFTEKSLPPKMEFIEKELQSSFSHWQSLTVFIRATCKTTEELRFLYGKDYGWALRFQSGNKLLCALFPNKGYFVTLLIVSQAQLKQIQGMKVSNNIQSAIESANSYREGKWLFIRSEAKEDIKGIRVLVEMKLASAKARSKSKN
jgi:hypothetical protein